jgi:hypothetical protein
MKISVILIALFVLFSAPQVLAEGKVGYVDSQRIFAELPEFQEA